MLIIIWIQLLIVYLYLDTSTLLILSSYTPQCEPISLGLAPPLARLGYHMSPYLYQFQYRMLILLQVWLRMRPLVRTRSIALKLLLRTRGSHNLNMSTYQPNQAAPHLSRSGRTAPHLLQLTPSHFLAAKPSRYLTIPLPHLTCLS